MNQQTIFHLAIRNRKMLAVGMLLCFALTLSAQSPVLNKQRHFRKNVPAGNYSGITWLGADRYAIVNDKSATAGFRLLTIHTDPATGAILDVRDNGFMNLLRAAHTNAVPLRRGRRTDLRVPTRRTGYRAPFEHPSGVWRHLPQPQLRGPHL